MRYLFLTLLICVLLTSIGCKEKSESTGGRSTLKDGIIGTWEDNSNPIFSSTITILIEDGQLYLENKYNDGSTRRTKLVEKESSLGRRFDPIPSTQLGDHWVIDSNGDLLLRDNNGTASTAQKIQ